MKNIYLGAAFIVALYTIIFYVAFGWPIVAYCLGGLIIIILIPGGFAGFIPNPFKRKKKE